MRQLQKKIKTGTLNLNQDDPFELFVAATNIRYCYYNETHKILGNTFGMCVLQVSQLLLSCRPVNVACDITMDRPIIRPIFCILPYYQYQRFFCQIHDKINTFLNVFCVKQDFEAITPNLLARTIETVEGGGIIVLLLRTMNSLKQLYTMTMVSLLPVLSPAHTSDCVW